MNKTKAVALPEPEAVLAAFMAKKDSSGLIDLIHAADRGDVKALSNLRVIYAAMPEIASSVSSWQFAVEHEILRSGADQPGITATFAEQANRLRKNLAGENSTPLEEILVNRIIIDHLHALKSEQILQQKMSGSLSLTAADFYQKQAERAQRRLLRSTKTLAEVRKLLRPAVQVNIAEQQVNFAGDVRTGEGNRA